MDNLWRYTVIKRVANVHAPVASRKTTLARQLLAADHPNYFDLELPMMRQSLANPFKTLSKLDDLAVVAWKSSVQ